MSSEYPPGLVEHGAPSTALLPMRPDELDNWIARDTRRREWLSAIGFRAKPGKHAVLPLERGSNRRAIVVPFDTPPLWQFAGFPFELPEGRYSLPERFEEADQTAMALGWAIGSHTFARYRKPERQPAELAWPRRADRNEVTHLASSVILARELIDTPAQDLGPEELADIALAIANEAGARGQVFVGDELLAANYPCVHAVGRASSRLPRLIDIRWGNPEAPKVTLVGKGVCFDTGGLDLKTREGMLEMKRDMGGAAVMLGLAQSLMRASAPIRLRLMIAAVENSVSGNAFRPLDIIRTRLGKTVEIGNTDAEGRLILCDALAEADSEEPDLLVDCATLTGASRVALGTEIQALFCDDEASANELVRLSLEIDDPVWRMPLWRGYRRLIDSPIADFNNVPKGQLGAAIVAAVYLSEFVSRARVWMHLDIMAANKGPRPGRPEGGEASGLLALYYFIRRRYG